MPFDLQKSRYSELREWCSEHGLAAVNAAEFVGGTKAGAAVLSLLDEIRDGQVLNLRHLRRLGHLRDLLAGDGPDIDFCVDPMDARLDDVCRLAESLGRALGAASS